MEDEMGVADLLAEKKDSLIEQQNAMMRKFFEPRLEALGLGVEQLQKQDLEQLTQSLERVNDAIKNPGSFGVMKVRADTGIRLLVVESSAHFEIGILPLLLERKQLIVARIAELRKEMKIDSLRGLIEALPNDGLKTKLHSELEGLAENSLKLKQQSEEIERAQNEIRSTSEMELARLRVEVFERRSKIWRSFLERESIATIVGAILLLVMGTAILVSMFTKVTISEIVSSTFLLILGYFFGQTSRTASNPQ
jgi:uncharacterized membrane protein